LAPLTSMGWISVLNISAKPDFDDRDNERAIDR
jgi:hypothetical protein